MLAQTRAAAGGAGVGLAVSEAAVAWLAGAGTPAGAGCAAAAAHDGSREVDRRLSRMLLAGELAAGDEVRVEAPTDPADAAGLVMTVTRDRDDGRG